LAPLRTCPSCRQQFAPELNFCPIDGARLEGASAAPPLPASGRDLRPGTTVGEYEITSKIADGGMGTVYAGVHPVIGKRVAIKILSPALATDVVALNRFLDEARSVNRIGHPNIVDIFAFGQIGDCHYFVMELLEGRTLTQEIERQRPVPRELAFSVLDAVCDALDAAHQRSIVHRDLKPDNIFLVQRAGNDVFTKLLDFGIAKLTDERTHDMSKTKTGVPLGTPFYMSPEQCRGLGVDWRTDIYSLGVIMYEMFTGALPFTGESYIEIMQAHMLQQPRPPQQIAPLPPGLGEAIVKALAKQAAARFQSAAELRTELARVARLAAKETPVPALGAEPPRRDRQRIPTAAALPILDEDGDVHFSHQGAYLGEYERNIRSRGLQVQSLRPLALRERIDLRLHLPTGGTPVEVQAEVVYANQGVLGLQLEPGPEAEQRLAQAAVALVAQPEPTPASRPTSERPSHRLETGARPSVPPSAFPGFSGQLTRAFDFPDIAFALSPPAEAPVRLEAATLVELLRALHAQSATGKLMVESAGRSKQVYVYDGNPATIVSHPPREEEQLGRLIMGLRKLKESELKQAVDQASASGHRLGTVLVEMGLLTRAQLDGVLRFQVLTRAAELFGWGEGRYSFTPGRDATLEAEAHAVKLESLFVHQVRNFLDRRSLAEITAYMGDRIHRAPAIKSAAAMDTYVPEMRDRRALLHAIDGKRAVREVLSACALGRVQTLRHIVVLLNAGVVELHSPSSGHTEESERQRLVQRFEHVASLDLFERIGLHYSSHSSEVEPARRRTERDLKDLDRVDPVLARQVRPLVQEAITTISDTASRRHYRVALLGAERVQFVAEHLYRQAQNTAVRGEVARAVRMLDVAQEMHASPEASALRAKLTKTPS
jgi:serine/threonine protein kinase